MKPTSAYEKVEMARRVLNNWARLQGHDKCWHHPEILTELCEIFDVSTVNHPPCLPTREEFRSGCLSYEGKLYGMVK